MMRSALLLCLVGLAVPASGAAQVHRGHSEHAEKVDREIKALSHDRMAALLGGEGAGYALAAELNRHPGPRHVMDLEQELDLTEGQLEAIVQIFEEMNRRARELGSRLVEAERELDGAFRDRSATERGVRERVSRIGELEAELRYVHLEAHLRTTALLSHDQIRRYDEARGYAQGHDQEECDGPPTTVVMRRCQEARLGRSTEELEHVLQQFPAILDESRADLLQRSQEAWEAHRAAYCRFVSGRYEGGSLRPVVLTACFAEVTAARVRQLRRQSRQEDDA